jgi:hypothetical protein
LLAASGLLRGIGRRFALTHWLAMTESYCSS